MKNLFDFFFSFDKLLKEKLIIPFFWLAIIVWGLSFFSTALDTIQLDPLAKLVAFVNYFATILLALVTIRLFAELAVALFRINDNLSPDGGKSESADIDIMAETKKAAEAAAHRAKEFTHSATEKTKTSFESVKDNMEDVSESVQTKAKSVTQSTKAKTSSVAKKTSETVKSAAPKKTVSKPKTTPKAAAPKKTTASASAPKKRGPKPGSKAPRDKDGNLLKKDGTPRAKPGPKAK